MEKKMIFEYDKVLNEKEMSLKKKIFSLQKMESLVHSDPKLSAIYNEMAEEGEEKYGYHYNETIMNIIFNEYVLNSSKYLQKYKNAIPKKKKRRDKSGINQLIKAGETEIEKRGGGDIDETTTASSAGGANSYVGYATPAAWSKSKTPAMKKPIWSGGSVLSEINEDYVINPEYFEFLFESVNDVDMEKIDLLSKKYHNVINNDKTSENEKDEFKNEFGEFLDDYVPKSLENSVDALLRELNLDEESIIDANPTTIAMKPPINANFSGVETGVNSSSPMNEEAKSKSQKRFMNMVSGVKSGKINPEKVSDEINKAAKTMTKKEIKDFTDTDYDALPEKIDEINNLFSRCDELLGEEKRVSALVNIDRIGNQNKENFKNDLKHSGIGDVLNIEKELEYKDQQTEIKDPKKMSSDIEKNVRKNEELKNVGNSSNKNGDEITKRNLTDDEAEEQNNMRLGLGDYIFDNEPDEKFLDRMKRDMGDKLYGERESKIKIRKEMPMYNKDVQPVDMNENVFTGKYKNELGKNVIIDFNVRDVIVGNSLNENWFKLDLNGMGNTVTTEYEINETYLKYINDYDFYYDGENVFALKLNKILNENNNKDKENNSELNKMKHLFTYKPSDAVDTFHTKKYRGF